jgi:hypothetical protein
MGDCHDSFFAYFVFFLAIFFLAKSRFSNARLLNRKTFFLFLLFCQNLAALAGHHRQILWVHQINFFPHFSLVMEPPQEAPPPQQANQHPRGHSSGVPNYRNDILVNIVEQQLPQGTEAWRNVALLYQNALNRTRGENICDNWVRKLCNNFKKPTGRPHNNLDRIFCCLKIERQIQRKGNAAILGATSDDSDHDNNIGSRESDNFSLGSGFNNNPEVAAATSQNDDGNWLADKQANSEEAEVVDAATVRPVNANCVCSQSLPTFIGGRPSGNVATGSVVLAMTSDARGGGGQG